MFVAKLLSFPVMVRSTGETVSGEFLQIHQCTYILRLSLELDSIITERQEVTFNSFGCQRQIESSVAIRLLLR